MSKGLGHEESGQHRDTGHIPFGRSSNYVCRLEKILLKRDQLQHAVGCNGRRDFGGGDWRNRRRWWGEEGGGFFYFFSFFFLGGLVCGSA